MPADLINEFGYIIDKIKTAEFSTDPFDFILIKDFLTKEHFDQIIAAEEINRPVAKNTEELIDDLLKNNKIISGYLVADLTINFVAMLILTALTAESSYFRIVKN